MAITINQVPAKQEVPVGQKILFSVSDTSTIATHYNVRYCCDIYFSHEVVGTAYKVSTLKTTPNSAGYGIFDLHSSLESMIESPRVIDDSNSNVMFLGSNGIVGAPVHYVEQTTNLKNSTGLFYCTFYVKASVNPSDKSEVIGTSVTSSNYTIHNIYPDANDVLYNDNGNYYFDYDELNILPKDTDSKFLTDMPLEVDVRMNDAGTLGMFQNFGNLTSHTNVNIDSIQVNFYDSSGSLLSTDSIASNVSGGGFSGASLDPSQHFNLVGVYPANIKQHITIPADTSYYEVAAVTGGVLKTRQYRFNIKEDCKHTNIRLTWLNKYGAWDYYSFNAKSVKTTSSKKKTFNQTQGSYQGSGFSYDTASGGSKVYDVQSKESYVLNTDYLNEDTGIWLESIMNSTEVYIIKDSTWTLGDAVDTLTNFADLIEPVLIKNSSMVNKTVQNDKMIMHTIQVEKAINNNTRKR
tara:strand:+ start:1889 stop:3280 length:1392 start_codon:yes stop_codon:yes gene_type:complete